MPDQGGGPPPADTKKASKEPLPPEEEEDAEDLELARTAYKGPGIEKNMESPHLHRHPVKDHPGYEQKWHPIEQKHKTGEHAELHGTGGETHYDKPWYEVLGIKHTESGDTEHFIGSAKGWKTVAADLFPHGMGYAVRISDDKRHFQKDFPKEYDARNWLQAMYEQGTYEPNIQQANLAEKPKAEKPTTFKGEFDLDPDVGTPVREMLNRVPANHLAHIDAINQREQTRDVEYAFGQLSLRRGISPERAKDIIAGFIGLHATGDALDDHFKRAQAGKERFPSPAAGQGIREFKVESYRMYLTDPKALQRLNPAIHKTLKEQVFKE